MKKTILLSAAVLAFTTSLSFSMDNLEIQSGETKIKMSLTKPVIQKVDEKQQEPDLLFKKIKKVDLGSIDPATSSISTLDELAKYAHDRGKVFYFNTASGLTWRGGGATPLYPVEKWQGDHIVGLIDDGRGAITKAVILKNQITGAYVDAVLTTTQEDTPKQ